MDEKSLIEIAAKKEFSDFDLVEMSRNGDHFAFREIVMRHKSRIASTIYGMIGNCDEAEDIGQEVFIRFYNSMDNFRGESLLITYLTRIAINLSLNEIKRRRTKRLLSFDKMVDEGLDITDNVSSGKFEEDKEIIQIALQKLNTKYRSVLVLRLIDGYSTEETAKILKLPFGTVLSRLARAQKKLKELLIPYKNIL